MNSKLLTIAGAALFLLALEVNASAATTFDVSGGWLLLPDAFAGSFDPTGTTAPNIQLYNYISNVDITDFDELVSAGHLFGPIYTATVSNEITGAGEYTLSFDYTLPMNGNPGFLDLAKLSEIVDVEVCGRGETNCRSELKDVTLALLGLGDVNIDVSDNGNGGAAPLPPALSLFATGLAMLGLLGWWRARKPNGAALITAV